MKYGTAFAFVLVLVGLFTWANFGEVSVSTQIDRLYSVTPSALCFVFVYHWYRVKELSDKIEKLERIVGGNSQA